MRLTLLFVSLSIVSTIYCQPMQLTDETTRVNFTTRHLLGRLEGTFKGVKGTVLLDTNHLSEATFNFAFAAGTVVHNDYQVGPNLLRKGCLDVNHYPDIVLQSTGISKLGNNQYQFTGSLTVKGITRSLSFPFSAKPNWGGYDFTFSFPIRKKDFKLHCSIHRKLKINVVGYGKKQLSSSTAATFQKRE